MASRDGLSRDSGTSDDERRLRLIIEATPNAMVMVDVDGNIVLVNSQTETLFGHTREDLLTMRVEQLIPERFHARHEGYRRGFFASPDTRSMGAGRDLYGLRKDGREVPIEIGLNPLETDDGAFVLASIIDITERKRSEERLLHVVEAAPNAMIMVNEAGSIVLVNSQTETSFGYRREELLSMRVEDLIPERFRPRHDAFRAGFFASPDRREMGVGRELFGRRKDGTEMPIEIGLNPIQILDENFVLASIIDITERLVVQRAQTALRDDLLRKSILDSLPFCIIATDADGIIVTANPAAESLLAYPQHELVGSPIYAIHGTDEEVAAITVEPGESFGLDEREWVYRHKDGTSIPVNESNAALLDGRGQVNGYLTVAYDITKRKQAQAAVRHMAQHDVLTDLPNRTLLFDHLLSAIARAGTDPSAMIVVLLLDLDHFKRVNDSLGHHVGDELLLRMVPRLQGAVRETDLVSRLGGDEFVVVFTEVDDTGALTARIDALMNGVSAPIEINGHELIVTASMGGAIYPYNGSDPATLLKNADTAMYHAKTSGRNNFQWFLDSLLDETNDKIALAGSLRHALDRGELSVAYQPLVSLDTGHVIGMEALARWHSADHGSLSPARFIPVAEDSGMILQLGEWMLRQACTDAMAIRAELGRPLRLAVNVSPRQVRSDDWLKTVADVLNDTGFDPADLELEITEGILMEDPRDVIQVLHATRQLGINIVVDDFGTGFSSLAYLTRFPIDKIKIDRSFVRDLTVDDADAAIVDTIIAMAHTLKMKVVAEGVETDEQRMYLRERACDEAQGYLYKEAVGADRLVAAVREIEGTPADRVSARHPSYPLHPTRR
ncbi:MAG: EAL domain-containing protein [Propionibacteriales bacterium]|nr:EAL domain-containing protein [Propionibacteriales bacterium]